MTVFLDGIAAQFYRGIGAEVQYIAPFSSVNFFIGANNSGKSIVLCLLAEQLAQAKSGKNIKPLEGPEVHRARETGQFLMAVGRRAETISNEITKENEAKHFQAQTYEYPQRTFGTEVRKICEKLTVNGQLWTVLKGHEPMQLHPSVAIQTAKNWDAEWQAVWSALTGQGRGGFDHWIPETLRVIAQRVMPALPSIFLVPAKRVLGKKDEAFDDLSGKGLIDHMASLQSPDYNRWKDDTEKFDRINRFLQEVTGKEGARCSIPDDHIDHRRSAFFMARSVLRDIRDGVRAC